MKDLLEKADEFPVTLVVVIAYVTLAFLTDPIKPPSDELYRFGMMSPLLAAHGEPWRLLASAFLHGGVLHLLMNLYALIAFGPGLERALGSVRFALLYVVAALGGSVAVCWLYNPLQPVLGGSGALFGMLGAVVAYQMRMGRNVLSFLDHSGPRRMLGYVVVALLFGYVVPNISNTAHVGGLLAGFLVTFLFLVPPREGTTPMLQAWRGAFALLLAGMLFWSLMPVTRWDWLVDRSLVERDPERRAQLERAACRDAFGQAVPPKMVLPELLEARRIGLESVGRK